MPEPFTHDVFLSHSAKDKAVVRPLAERLRQDGLQVLSNFGSRIADSGRHGTSPVRDERSRTLPRA